MRPDWIKEIEEQWEDLFRTEGGTGQQASVLLPLVRDGEGRTAILFEHRAKDLDVQPDEICFPGGGIEPGETPREAAVRETCEELRIKPEQIRVFGAFDGLEDRAVTTIHTFAGALDAYEGSFAPEEVDHVFTVPLDWLLSHEPEVYGTVLTTIPDEDFPFDRIPGGRDYPWRRRRTEVWFYQYGDETIWGLTARILHTFLKRLQEIEKSLK